MSDQNADDLKIKGQQKAAWDDSAEGWKRWWPTFERAAQTVNDRLVELANVRPGNRVLDIATGSGEPALTAARAADNRDESSPSICRRECSRSRASESMRRA